jgi:hypothetical protein
MRVLSCALAALCLIASGANAEDGLFATQIQLDGSEIFQGGWLRAFVPTGSDSEVCFVNLGDSGYYGTLIGPPVCIRRTFHGVKGVVVILMPEFAPLPTDFSMRVSLYQKGARYYGVPAIYDAP